MSPHDASPVPVITDVQLALRERVKELNCVYQVFRETESVDRPLDEMFRAVVRWLPPAWLHVAHAVARIRYKGHEFATDGFRETLWMQSAPFAGGDGELTVVYLVACPDEVEGPFLREERELLNTIAARLGEVVARRETLDRLKLRETVYSSIVEQARDSIAIMDPRTGRFVEFNDSACETLGYTRDEFAQLSIFDIDPDLTREAFSGPELRLMAEAGSLEARHRRKDGSMIDVRVSSRGIFIRGAEYRALIWLDVTERKRAERAVLRANRRLRGIADATRAIVFAQDEQALFDGVCEAIVHSGGYRLAWIGWAQDDERCAVTPVAHAGAAADYVEAIDVSWSAELPSGHGPSGRAIREQQAVASRNIDSDDHFRPWRDVARKHGFGSTVALPILRGPARARGALAVYADVPDAFDQEEIDHLQNLVDALSFGISALRDRHARDQAREALQSSTSRLSRLLEASPVVIYQLRLERDRWVPSDLSDNITRLFGYSLEECLRPSWWSDHLHVEDRTRALEGFKALNTSDRYAHEYRFARKNGDYIWIHDEMRVERDPAGQPVSIVGAWTNVTDRRDAEEQVRKLSAAIEQSPNAVIITDLAARIEYVNEAFIRKTGYSRSEAYGRNPKFLQSGQTPQSTYDAFWAALTSGQPWRGEFINRVKDGTIQVERAVVVPLRQPDGRISHYVAVKEDVTEQKRIEEQLRQLYLAVEQSPESIVISDLDARIQYVNEAFTRHSGYSREEVIGLNPRVLQSGKTPKSTYRDMWETLQRGEAWRGEFHNRRKDGSEYTEFAIVAPIRQPGGQVTHYLAIKDDITQKKAVEAELDRHRHHLQELVDSRTVELAEARKRAETASVAKSAFLANMSHEIRTPMNAIIGLTHLLRRGNPTPEQAAQLDKIDTSARHLLSIVNDILDLSKIEAGRMSIERVEFDLQQVIKEAFVSAVLIAEEKGVQATFDVATGVPQRVMGDPVRVRQILVNLCGNAAKFTDHGSITLQVTAAARSPEVCDIRFEVTDTGIGLSDEQLSRLFVPFEQADTSTSRKYGGTGLGLAITRRLVDAMGGALGASGAPGVGSTFWFSIPFGAVTHSVAPAASAARVAASTRRPSEFRILLVEDNAINQEVAEQILKQSGYQVELASDGFAALAMAAKTTYDVVLMDVQMPGLDGLETTRRLRASAAYASTPVIAMTASVFNEDRDACFAAGMNDFIGKPVDPARLVDVVQQWTGAAAEPIRDAIDDAPPARLTAVPGLDVAAGLRSVRGDAASLERLLRAFAANRHGDAASIRAAIAEGRVADAIRLAHTLKGLGGTIGALRVAAAAQQVELLLREPAGANESLPAALDDLAVELRRVIDGLQSSLSNTAAVESGDLDWRQVRETVAELMRLLTVDDARAAKLASQHDQTLRHVLGPDADAFAALVAGFQFHTAVPLLKRAIDNRPELKQAP